jgi:hypothetical protein
MSLCSLHLRTSTSCDSRSKRDTKPVRTRVTASAQTGKHHCIKVCQLSWNVGVVWLTATVWQCIAVSTELLAMCYTVWQCTAVSTELLALCYTVWQCTAVSTELLAMCYSVWQCTAVSTELLAMCYTVWQCTAVRTELLAMCYTVWQCTVQRTVTCTVPHMTVVLHRQPASASLSCESSHVAPESVTNMYHIL